jgi:hypothetical protein
VGPPAPGRQDLDVETIAQAVADHDATQAFLSDLGAFLQAQPPKVTPKPAAAASVPQAAVVSARPPCRAPMTADVDEMKSIVVWAAHEIGVDPGQLLRIPPRESGFNPDSVNCSSGACGLFQHLPQYWPGRLRAVGLPEGTPCTDPRANALVAANMFASSGFGPWYPSGPY